MSFDLPLGPRSGSHRARIGPDAIPPALELEDVWVSFQGRPVLAGASLSCRSGELIALVGGNGSGKSTMLRAAAGFEALGSGRVLIEGTDASSFNPRERVAAGLAFVSGSHPVFPGLTVQENLRVAAYRTHKTRKQFAAATDAIIPLVPAISDRLRSKAGVLSGGEQRLLAIAQTLYARPKILLADELTLGLHPEVRVTVLGLLRHLADEGKCVVVVDHDLSALLPIADSAAALISGSVKTFHPATAVLDEGDELLPASFLTRTH